MNVEIFENPELYFAIIGIIVSLFCGRISIVSARGGLVDKDFFSLTIGLIANFVWVSGIIWFVMMQSWIIPIIAVLISLFGFNKLVQADNNSFYRMRNLLRLISIFCLLGMWHSYFI